MKKILKLNVNLVCIFMQVNNANRNLSLTLITSDYDLENSKIYKFRVMDLEMEHFFGPSFPSTFNFSFKCILKVPAQTTLMTVLCT